MPRTQRLPAEQSEKCRRAHSAGRAGLRHRRQRLGKITLINQTLLPALKRKLYALESESRRRSKPLNGVSQIDKVIEIDQSPIGRTPRSNPATYTGVFDEIRKVFAKTQGSQNPRLRGGPIQLQRQRRPLRSLPGPGDQVHRDALSAGCVRRLRSLPRHALQRRDAGDSLSRQERSPTC